MSKENPVSPILPPDEEGMEQRLARTRELFRRGKESKQKKREAKKERAEFEVNATEDLLKKESETEENRKKMREQFIRERKEVQEEKERQKAEQEKIRLKKEAAAKEEGKKKEYMDELRETARIKNAMAILKAEREQNLIKANRDAEHAHYERKTKIEEEWHMAAASVDAHERADRSRIEQEADAKRRDAQARCSRRKADAINMGREDLLKIESDAKQRLIDAKKMQQPREVMERIQREARFEAERRKSALQKSAQDASLSAEKELRTEINAIDAHVKQELTRISDAARHERADLETNARRLLADAKAEEQKAKKDAQDKWGKPYG